LFAWKLRYFPALVAEYVSSSIEADFIRHHFLYTLNTLLDESGLSDLLQTEWFTHETPKRSKSFR